MRSHPQRRAMPAATRSLVLSLSSKSFHQVSIVILIISLTRLKLDTGYFRSKYFLGSVFATGMGLMAAVGQFGYAAPILGIINEDIGPDPNYVWISLVYNVCLAVFLPIVGRLSGK